MYETITLEILLAQDSMVPFLDLPVFVEAGDKRSTCKGLFWSRLLEIISLSLLTHCCSVFFGDVILLLNVRLR